MNVAELAGVELDYWMYQHACKATGQHASRKAFDEGYRTGDFHFSTDKALALDLIQLYSINLQMLSGEWLAFARGMGYYAATPNEALCRLVVALRFGKEVAEQ
ncbi:MAG TPA: hypothetical protein VFM46_17540 [Pseudomonadales bacterium]|nr:hypothetical protein [Pseudomonadales bacterium]